MQKRLKRILGGLILLGFLIPLDSCSPLKIAQRKARKADRLLKEAGILAPSIMDTVYVLKTDTLILTKDSLVSEVNLVLDSTKVDSLINELVRLKIKGSDTRAIKKELLKEAIPDVHYHNIDSLPVTIDGVTSFIRYDINITLEDDKLRLVVKPINNIPIVTSTATISIDATRKRWWQDWTFWVIVAIIAAIWFFRGILGEVIKKI